jgi:hypothetical protein
MLSVAKSRARLPVQLTFAITNGVGALLGGIYSRSTHDLYENQKHSPVGWVGVVLSLLWLVITLAPKASVDKRPYSKSFHSYQQSYETLLQSSHCSSFELQQDDQGDALHSSILDDADDTNEKLPPGGRFYCFTTSAIFSRIITWVASKSLLQPLPMLGAVLDRSILVLGFICLVTGVVVFSGSFVSLLNQYFENLLETSLTNNIRPARQARIQWSGTFNQRRHILLVRPVDFWSLAWLPG